jgi:hypothetical protein
MKAWRHRESGFSKELQVIGYKVPTWKEKKNKVINVFLGLFSAYRL